MSVLRQVLDGPAQGRSIASPPEATRLAIRQVVVFLGGGVSSVRGPVLYAKLDGKWVETPWTPADRLAVPEVYDHHFFTR